MYMKMTSERFLKLADHLRVGTNFESLVVEVGDGSGDKDGGLNCAGIGNDSQVLMQADFDKVYFEEVVGEETFVWNSEKILRYAGFLKEEATVMLTTEGENIILESFDKEGNRVQRIAMPMVPKEAAKNYLNALPGKFREAEGSKYPDIPLIHVKRGQYDIRVKVDSTILQKIVKRALEFNQYHFPISFAEGILNIQSGAHMDRATDSYDRNIAVLDHEAWGEKKSIDVKCGPSFLHVLQVVSGEIYMDLGTDTPIWLTTREISEEKKARLYQVHYFVVPRIYEEKEVKEAGGEAEAAEDEAEPIELDV